MYLIVVTATDAAMNAGDRNWMIAGVSLRSAEVAERMNPQQGLYTGLSDAAALAAILRAATACRVQSFVHRCDDVCNRNQIHAARQGVTAARAAHYRADLTSVLLGYDLDPAMVAAD